MNNKEYINELARRSGYTQEVTRKLVHDVVAEMTDRLGESETVSIAGFGSFEVKKRLERIHQAAYARAPETGVELPSGGLGEGKTEEWRGRR